VSNGRHQIGDAVEQVVVSDLAAQVFSEPLDQVELGRVGGQGHHLQAIGVLGQHGSGLLRPMDDVVIDHQHDLGTLPDRVGAVGGDNLVDQPDEGIRVLVLADMVRQLTGHEVDCAEPVALDVLARRRDLTLLTAFRPAADHAGQ